jgi:hypothetical protein
MYHLKILPKAQNMQIFSLAQTIDLSLKIFPIAKNTDV